MRDRLSLRIGIAAFALIVATSSPVRADYLSAISAYEIGAYEVAFGEFRPLAQSGDPAAQYHLGLMFRDGRGVQKDPVTALGWFICAAGLGGQAGAEVAGTDSQLRTDAAKSAEQLSSALDPASVSVAQEKARSCRATAEKHALAQSGDPAAQYDLGLMFKDGRGVQKDPVTALGWFICAAGLGGQAGTDAARSAEQLSSTLDRASVSAAQEKARSCRATADKHALAQSGDPAAQYRLGLMFKDGRGVRKDPVTALGWLLCAAGSDGQVGADAARSAEQLSSTLDRASVSAAQEKARNCRATAEVLAQQGTGEESQRPAGTGKESQRPAGTGKGSERPAGTGEASERPDIANSLDWETFTAKLSRLFQKLSLVEVGGLESSQSFFSAPTRRSIWSRAFYLPADGTLVGSQHVAWEFGAKDLYLDLRSIARSDNNIALALFAVLWWLLIGKTLFSMGGVLLRVFRRSELE